MTVPVIILAVIFYGLVAYGVIIGAGQHRRAREERARDVAPLDRGAGGVDVAAIEADGSVAARAQDAADPVAGEALSPPPTETHVYHGPLTASRTTRRRYWH